MLAREVSFLAAQAGDGDGALPLQKPDHRRDWVLGWNCDAHVHVVRHQVTLDDLALLLLGQRVEDRTQLPTRLAEDGFPASFGHEHHVCTCSPILNGIGSDKFLTLNPLLVDSSSHLERILLPQRSNLFQSHWSNQWLTKLSY